MSEVHRYKVVTMLSEEGNRIGYDPHGPEVVMASAYDELKAESETLRKDAERYRWLRDGAGYCDTRDIPGMAPARMDAFIDAALAKERGQ